MMSYDLNILISGAFFFALLDQFNWKRPFLDIIQERLKGLELETEIINEIEGKFA